MYKPICKSIAFFQGIQDSPTFAAGKISGQIMMSLEHWLNDGGKNKSTQRKILSQCHFSTTNRDRNRASVVTEQRLNV
jgi:hypothetical protein